MEPGAPDGPEEGQESGETRTRVAFDAHEELIVSLDILAAFRGVKRAELAREAVADYISRAKLAEEDAEFEKAPKRGKNQRKELFTKALKRRFYPILAAGLAKVSLKEVSKWEAEDENFERLNNEAQQYFVCKHELDSVLDSKKKPGKDRYLFWQSFQNAHNKNHGRLKGELMAQHFKDLMDKAFALAEKMFSPGQAKEFKESLKEIATKKLLTMTD